MTLLVYNVAIKRGRLEVKTTDHAEKQDFSIQAILKRLMKKLQANLLFISTYGLLL